MMVRGCVASISYGSTNIMIAERRLELHGKYFLQWRAQWSTVLRAVQAVIREKERAR
jgi:hypothetical protein